jgi:hypothetical protein
MRVWPKARACLVRSKELGAGAFVITKDTDRSNSQLLTPDLRGSSRPAAQTPRFRSARPITRVRVPSPAPFVRAACREVQARGCNPR